MRMWNVPTGVLCTKHLLGEHVEMHMFVGTINKKMSIRGYLENGLVDTSLIKWRHEQLAKEIKNRGFNHRSPLLSYKIKKIGSVNVKENLKELSKRCKDCRKRINKN